MTAPNINDEKDSRVGVLARLAGSLALWAVAFIAANRILNADPASPLIRAGAVALAVFGCLPWIWMASRAIVAEDEFTRRVHFIALSWAFAATGVFVMASDFLARAHFIDYLPIMYVWMFMIVAWWISIMLTARYYR